MIAIGRLPVRHQGEYAPEPKEIRTRIPSWQVSDAVWVKVEPLLPCPKRDPERTYRRKPGEGRKPLPARTGFRQTSRSPGESGDVIPARFFVSKREAWRTPRSRCLAIDGERSAVNQSKPSMSRTLSIWTRVKIPRSVTSTIRASPNRSRSFRIWLTGRVAAEDLDVDRTHPAEAHRSP